MLEASAVAPVAVPSPALRALLDEVAADAGIPNFLDLVDRVPWPELVRFCDEHHVELLNAIGGRDYLVSWWPDEDRRRIDEVLDAGTRSIAFCYDDIPTSNPAALASQHATVFRDLYAYLRARDPGIRVSAVLPPYGGIPGRTSSSRSRGVASATSR